jgi:ribosomal-protein-alanine N-acetyltransferase
MKASHVLDLQFDPQTRCMRTARLQLRPLLGTDAVGLLSIYSQPEVTRYYELDTMTELAQAQRILDFFLQHHDRFALIEPNSQQMIGTCGLFFWDQTTNMASFGYDLAQPYWGRGLMHEATTAVLAYGFAIKQLNRINALTAKENQRSIRLLQLLGFQQEAVLRQFAFWKGEYHDMRMFGLLRQELPKPIPGANGVFALGSFAPVKIGGDSASSRSSPLEGLGKTGER